MSLQEFYEIELAAYERAHKTHEKLARVLELHRPTPVYTECGHDHDGLEPGINVVHTEHLGYVCENGKLYDVCIECCSHEDGYESEYCANCHDHGPDKPICATIAAINGEEKK